MGSGLTEHLETLLQGVSPAGPDLKLALSRLSTELKARLANGTPSSVEFVTTSLRALSKVKGAAHAEVRMSCLFDACVYLFTNKHDTDALDAAKQLGALATQVGNASWLRKAHALQGMACAHKGDLGEAVLQYSRALDLATELGENRSVVSVLSNLGATLNYAGLYREAIPCLRRALVICKNYPEAAPYEPSALCNLAQSHFHLGEFSEGLEAASKCLALSSEPTDSFESFSRAVRELTFVQLALEDGKLSAARKHSQLCVRYARQSGTKRGTFIADIAEGLCEIHGGDVNRGLTMLERSLERSGDDGSIEHADALAALVRAYDLSSRPDEALERMRRLLSLMRKSRETSVLALLSVPHAAESRVTLVSEKADLQELTHKEAQLRARVAEREAANSRIEMLERLATTADLKEEASGEHGYRVGKLASLLAEDLEWSREAAYAIDLAARLHDIGKIAVPDRILLNSKELKAAERHFMSTHTIIGAELLAKSNIPQLRMAEEIARCHHEWWNGQGYPAKLVGKRIPIHARIVALADVFDALTHGRPFAEPWPMERAIEEIRSRRGTQFDPELTDAFLALVERLRREHQDLDEYLGRAGRNSPFLQARNKIRLMLAEEREHEKMATVTGNETRH